MAKVLGLDIGGANTKATFLHTKSTKIIESKTLIEYFPFWKCGKKLPSLLNKLKKELTNSTKLDGIGVTMTAEVSDLYNTKKEGINHILDCLVLVFRNTPIFVLDVKGNLLTIKDALKDPLNVASANWVATGWMISQIIKNCIIIDVGSTTTSIIPIRNGKIIVEGKNDLEKLHKGELVYTGSLRTNIATIVNQIPVFGKITKVSSELFSQSGDIHILLNNIIKEEYNVETCDGRGKTKKECGARLARVVCADTDMITEQEIIKMAKFVYLKQIDQIICGLDQVCQRIKNKAQKKTLVVTGLGRKFLAQKAAEKIGFMDIIDMDTLIGIDKSVVSPSVGVAFMMTNKLVGKKVQWKQF